MKSLTLTVLAIITALTINAQNNNIEYNSVFHQQNQFNVFNLKYQASKVSGFSAKDEKHWKKLKNAGIILTSFGTACIAGGIYFIAEDRRRNGAGSEGFGIAIGSAGIIGGATALGGGIAMLTIGNRHLKKLRNASISTSANGLGLALHF